MKDISYETIRLISSQNCLVLQTEQIGYSD